MYEKFIPDIVAKFNKFRIKSHSLPNAIGMWPNEQECLLWLALNSELDSNWMEIGSFCGGSAVLMSLARRATNNKRNSVYSVDCDFNKYKAMNGSQSYYGDVAMNMFDYNVYKQGGFYDICKKLVCYSDDIPDHYNSDDKIGLLFIDGYHSFNQVVKDFYTVKPYFSKNAIVAFHDVSPHIKDSSKHKFNWEALEESTEEDFCLDEAVSYILHKEKDFTLLDIPVKKNIKHFAETGLTKWVKGTTSPFNAVAAIRRK